MTSGMTLASTFAMLRPAQAGGTIAEIKWALATVPESLFVLRSWSTDTGVIMSLVQEAPLMFGNDLALEPGPAKSWSFTDPTTAVYKLRAGVTFSDGTPLTVMDVVATINFHLDPKSGSQVANFFSSVASAEATDPATVTVTVKLKAPNVQFQYWAAHMAGFIFKKDQYPLGHARLCDQGLKPDCGPRRIDAGRGRLCRWEDLTCLCPKQSAGWIV